MILQAKTIDSIIKDIVINNIENLRFQSKSQK